VPSEVAPEQERKPGVNGHMPGRKERCGEGICGERVHFIDGGGADPGQSYIDTGE